MATAKKSQKAATSQKKEDTLLERIQRISELLGGNGEVVFVDGDREEVPVDRITGEIGEEDETARIIVMLDLPGAAEGEYEEEEEDE
jgi:hypothetical protein